ncbi:STAS domain-containing protein [Sorangium sp. So ce295]|uniref:STAS domain-containing protein n=2 Tax=unclassified Sorangium TaxID=2621164 RepID=UPI003F5E4BFE
MTNPGTWPDLTELDSWIRRALLISDASELLIQQTSVGLMPAATGDRTQRASCRRGPSCHQRAPAPRSSDATQPTPRPSFPGRMLVTERADRKNMEQKTTPTITELEREIDALRRRVAELEIPARRYKALLDGGIVSMMIYDGESRVLEVNRRWEQLWSLSLRDVAGWRLLKDEQVSANGSMPLVEQAFWRGEATALPTIRYDPVQADTLQKGVARWVASSLHPINDAAGNVAEVLQIHVDVGELKQSEDELRIQTEQLEAAIAERTQRLEEQLRVSEEQQRAIAALSTPVLRLWDGILALPLIGQIDAERAARILDVLLQAIVDTQAEHVIIDVTGVPFMDAEGARHLRDTVRASSLLGARCAIAGISPVMARLLIDCDLGFDGVPIVTSLQDGLRRLLSSRNGDRTIGAAGAQRRDPARRDEPRER